VAIDKLSILENMQIEVLRNGEATMSRRRTNSEYNRR